ncbi:hypothetical protein [Nocardiopsis chromatogenes]|uniref:hypothetical protein n=1 Tax=Nocardiopsis chromatogenes TaxID=280239 RepID=UPI0003689337|nr:hypothetical protein [Nocardiopsis chromatogenes]
MNCGAEGLALGKVADARVTVVGGQTIAQAITTPDGLLDWRRGDWGRLHYEPLDVPGPVTEKLHAYLDHYNLEFGVFDFALTGSGDDPEHWWWMECNANGQWGWLPDSELIADAFARTRPLPSSARQRRVERSCCPCRGGCMAAPGSCSPPMGTAAPRGRC